MTETELVQIIEALGIARQRSQTAFDELEQTIKLLLTKPIQPPLPTTGVTPAVALEVGHYEAVVRQAYLDSTGKDAKWTWSVGLTSATGHNVERYIDNPQTLQRCMDVYVWALRNYAKQVDVAFGGFVLPQHAYAGAVSFHWNTGAIRNAKWPALYMAGEHKLAESDFKRYNRSGGKINQVLVNRRAAEADLIWRGVWANVGTMTEFTKLTSKHTPVWSSAKTVDVREDLVRAFAFGIEPMLDQPPQPNSAPEAPTLTPKLMG